MSEYIFLFDLDSTITKVEILPALSEQVGCLDKMRELTERTMRGEIPFKHSFLMRTDLLKDIPVSEIRKVIADLPLNDKIVEFIKENKSRCYVVTGNLDIWICELMMRIGMEGHYFSSSAIEKDDRLRKVISVIDKEAVVSQMIAPFVAVGDGDNDAKMIELADIGIGFGGVRPIAASILNNAHYAVYTEVRLCRLLKQLL